MFAHQVNAKQADNLWDPPKAIFEKKLIVIFQSEIEDNQITIGKEKMYDFFETKST